MNQHQTHTGDMEQESALQPFRFVHPVEKISPPIYIEGPKEHVSFSARLMEFGFADNARVIKIVLLAMVLITALYTKRYEGLYSELVQSHIGGVLYVMFGSLAASLFLPKLHVGWAVGMAFTATSILEWVQWFQFPFMVELTKNQAMAYLFGNSFNAVDFIYYAIGAVCSVGLLWLIREEPGF